MTEALPAPLVSAEVDLTDFAFMPLDVARLRDSDLASNETPEACWAAVLLWAASWHQIPAASIPNDDKWMAQKAGYGRVVKEWLHVKEGALRGFVLCDDGRFYHPVVAEKAREAWQAKLEQRWRTECGRIKKHNQRHDLSLRIPTFEVWMSLGCPHGQSLPVPEDIGQMSSGTNGSCPPNVPRETPSKGQREGQGQGQGSLIPPDGVSGPAPSAAPPPPPADFDGTNAGALNGKAVVAIAKTWELPEQWGVDAEALGWARAEVLREAEKFRQYWVEGKGKGKRRAVKGWRQAWSNWLARAAENRR